MGEMTQDSQQTVQRPVPYARATYTQKLKGPIQDEPLYRLLVVERGYSWKPDSNNDPESVSIDDWVKFTPPPEIMPTLERIMDEESLNERALMYTRGENRDILGYIWQN